MCDRLWDCCSRIIRACSDSKRARGHGRARSRRNSARRSVVGRRQRSSRSARPCTFCRPTTRRSFGRRLWQAATMRTRVDDALYAEMSRRADNAGAWLSQCLVAVDESASARLRPRSQRLSVHLADLSYMQRPIGHAVVPRRAGSVFQKGDIRAREPRAICSGDRRARISIRTTARACRANARRARRWPVIKLSAASILCAGRFTNSTDATSACC